MSHRPLALLPLLSLLPLLLAAAPESAPTVWTWEEGGVAHFTDEPERAPRTATLKQLDREPFAMVRHWGPAPKPDAALPRGPLALELSEQAEDEWRARFVQAHERVAALQSLVDLLATTKPSGEGSWGANHTRYPPRLAPDWLAWRLFETRRELHEATVALDRLDREASAKAVPRSWRRGW